MKTFAYVISITVEDDTIGSKQVENLLREKVKRDPYSPVSAKLGKVTVMPIREDRND